MWNTPSVNELSKIPKYYSSEEVPLKEKMIYMHFFIGNCNWYAAEYSPEERCFFGFAILNNDYEMAEWGYFSLDELATLRVKFIEVDKDCHWKPKKAYEIDKICIAQGWEKGKIAVCKAN